MEEISIYTLEMRDSVITVSSNLARSIRATRTETFRAQMESAWRASDCVIDICHHPLRYALYQLVERLFYTVD